MYHSTQEPLLYTVIAGVAVYVVGQIVQNFVLKPLQDLNVIKVNISHKMKFWANFLNNPDVNPIKTQEAAADMRDLSSNLESRYVVIPFKILLIFFGVIPTEENVREAAKELIFLSNTDTKPGTHSDNHDAIEKVKNVLGLTL